LETTPESSSDTRATDRFREDNGLNIARLINMVAPADPVLFKCFVGLAFHSVVYLQTFRKGQQEIEFRVQKMS